MSDGGSGVADRASPERTGLSQVAERRRRASVLTLVADHGLMFAGFSMLIPLLAVHFTVDFGMTATTVGVVLAVRQFAQQGLMVFGGAMGDRWGYKPAIVAGFGVRALGFLWFAYARELDSLIGAALVTAFGGALFEATAKAALANLVPADRRVQLFSVTALVASVGAALGPLIGVALLAVDFLWVGLASAGCFCVACALAAWVLPWERPQRDTQQEGSVFAPLAGVARDTRFVWFTVTMAGFWFVANQVYLCVPIHISRVTGDVSLVGYSFALQAVVAVTLQVPLVRLACRLITPLRTMAVGLGLMGVSLGAIALVGDGVGILLCVAGFAVGRVLVEPVRDAVTAEMAAPGAAAAYFGFGYLSLAFGGTIGNYVGGRLMDLSAAPEYAVVPWAVFAGVGAAAGVGMLIFSRHRWQAQETGGSANLP